MTTYQRPHLDPSHDRPGGVRIFVNEDLAAVVLRRLRSAGYDGKIADGPRHFSAGHEAPKNISIINVTIGNDEQITAFLDKNYPR